MHRSKSAELLHGTLDAMILRLLADRRAHGYGIGRALAASLEPETIVEDGSLYPALYRLERRRLIRGTWGTSESGRRARFYELTPAGRRMLRSRIREWNVFAAAVSRLLTGR